MREVARARRHFGQHAVHQRRVRTARDRGLLGLAHLRRSDHLHRFGDLGGVLDRLDPSAYVARAGHVSFLKSQIVTSNDYRYVCLNSVSAAFNSAASASLNAFSARILASNAALRVLRKSVSFA